MSDAQMTIADVEALEAGEVLPPGPPISLAEAQEMEAEIIREGENLRQKLVRFHQTRAWEVLGHGSFTAWATARFPFYAQGHLSRLVDAGYNQQEVIPMGITEDIPERRLRPLSALNPPGERHNWSDEEHHAAIHAKREAWQTAEQEARSQPNGKMTAKTVEDAVKKVGTEPLLERIPEEDRATVQHMALQPGIPLPLAQTMIERMAEAEPEQRREVLDLYRSGDVRDRNRAMTWAADRVTPADPRLITFKECIRELRRCVRDFPADPEVPLVEQAVALLEQAVQQIRGGGE